MVFDAGACWWTNKVVNIIIFFKALGLFRLICLVFLTLDDNKSVCCDVLLGWSSLHCMTSMKVCVVSWLVCCSVLSWLVFLTLHNSVKVCMCCVVLLGRCVALLPPGWSWHCMASISVCVVVCMLLCSLQAGLNTASGPQWNALLFEGEVYWNQNFIFIHTLHKQHSLLLKILKFVCVVILISGSVLTSREGSVQATDMYNRPHRTWPHLTGCLATHSWLATPPQSSNTAKWTCLTGEQ